MSEAADLTSPTCHLLPRWTRFTGGEMLANATQPPEVQPGDPTCPASPAASPLPPTARFHAMRRIVPRRPLSWDPREFVLAAILMTVGAVLFAGFAVTTLRGSTFSEGDLASAGLAFQVLGWGKYLGALRLAWLGDRATLHRRFLGWKRTALLWLPVVLFVLFAYLQWVVVTGARAAYLQRTGHPGAAGYGGMPLFLLLECALALALAALNALWMQQRQLRLAR